MKMRTLLIALIISFALSGCGNSSDNIYNADETQENVTTESEEFENVEQPAGEDDNKDYIFNEGGEVVETEINNEELDLNYLSDTSQIQIFTIDNEEYYLGCPISNFINNGWYYYVKLHLNPGEIYDDTLRKDDGERPMTLTVCNPYNEETEIDDCIVVGVHFNPDDNIDIEFSNGITLASTKDDIYEILGEPTLIYLHGFYIWLDEEETVSFVAGYYKSDEETPQFIYIGDELLNPSTYVDLAKSKVTGED